ncbi:UNVERIFIED_CONTAM: hypothetical protein RMT77_010081 [Armadillidium vulgare]
MNDNMIAEYSWSCSCYLFWAPASSATLVPPTILEMVPAPPKSFRSTAPSSTAPTTTLAHHPYFCPEIRTKYRKEGRKLRDHATIKEKYLSKLGDFDFCYIEKD